MENKTFNGDQKIKLTQIINEGCQVMHEIDTLQGGLTDTVKAIAEELEIKPAVLKKAIRLAHKASFGQEQQDQSLIAHPVQFVMNNQSPNFLVIINIIQYFFLCNRI